ncbi:hypothetical protein Lal_00039887 [Lupinus albus]|nr:hypothetical protein Lal_00039887 [Lupinus albus]
MASSSKKQRTNFSQRSQGTTSMKSNPLDLTKLLANDEQRKIFEEHFHCRTIFTLKFGNVLKFEFEDFLFPYLLRQQNLFEFCCESNDIYPELVRVFYCNMNFRKNRLTSYVKGKEIVLDSKTYGSLCCNIPSKGGIVGFGLQCEWDNYDRKEFYYSMCRISREEIELQPNPAAPQPFEFHAQSSSSAVMPTNQMIMDELVSLRGYVTNWMDAFDTQNQQILYELHCLSSKLSNVGVDEDNSEPES